MFSTHVQKSKTKLMGKVDRGKVFGATLTLNSLDAVAKLPLCREMSYFVLFHAFHVPFSFYLGYIFMQMNL